MRNRCAIEACGSVTYNYLRNSIEVVTTHESSYYVTFKEAQTLVAKSNAKWEGSHRVVMNPPQHKAFSAELWCVKQSGKCGPLTLQIVT